MTTQASKKALGQYGESLATDYLTGLGMVLLDHNWRCPAGEIDLVLRDGQVLVICEVKTPAPLATVLPWRRSRPPSCHGSGAWQPSGWLLMTSASARSASTWSVSCARRAGRRRSITCGGSVDMPFATAHTITLEGAVGHLVDVQVDVSAGLVGTTLVGRPDAAINEGRDRCRMAIQNSALTWPATRRVTILLSPADVPKSGPHFDLAMALAIVAASDAERLQPTLLDGTVFIGAPTLDGRLRPVPGVLPMTMAAARRGVGRVLSRAPGTRGRDGPGHGGDRSSLVGSSSGTPGRPALARRATRRPDVGQQASLVAR